MPVPPGWRVTRDPSRTPAYCEVPARSILVDVNVGPGGDCDARRLDGPLAGLFAPARVD